MSASPQSLLSKAPGVIVFDMDGVLVEVGESYREAIRETVRHFTGETVSHDLIQDFKNAGGWNNDWLLSHRLIRDLGREIEYVEVINYFNRIFLGEHGDGLIRREKWLPNDGLLDRLSSRVALAIFTGRAKYEADITLAHYAANVRFDPLITDESVQNPKPAGDGLELIKHHYPGQHLWYLGDTVDDARSSQAASVPFIGVSVPHNPRHIEIAQVLSENGASVVIGDVNELEHLLDQALSNTGVSV